MVAIKLWSKEKNSPILAFERNHSALYLLPAQNTADAPALQVVFRQKHNSHTFLGESACHIKQHSSLTEVGGLTNMCFHYFVSAGHS